MTLTAAIARLLDKDHSFSDVELQATDGEILSAHRTILAARSKVFKTLLFGKFVESSSSTVKLGYKGSILRAIVTYCYTDEVTLPKPNGAMMSEADKVEIEHILSVGVAADYFELPGLCERIASWATSNIAKNVEMAWQVSLFSDQGLGGSLDQTRMYEYAIQMAGNLFCEITLRPDDVCNLSPSFLETFLGNKHVAADEVDLFAFLQMWHSGRKQSDVIEDHSTDEAGKENIGYSNDNSGFTNSVAKTRDKEEEHGNRNDLGYLGFPPEEKDKETLVGDERRQVACALVNKHIDLRRIKPSDLREHVEPSRLVTTASLMEAYKTHDIGAYRSGNLVKETRRGPTWNSSNTDRLKRSRKSLCLDILKVYSDAIWNSHVVYQGTCSSQLQHHTAGCGGLSSGRKRKLSFCVFKSRTIRFSINKPELRRHHNGRGVLSKL
jgi:hypothetical protein